MRLIRWAGSLLAFTFGSGILLHAAPPAACNGQTLTAGFSIKQIAPAPGGSTYDGALKMAVWYPSSTTATTTYSYSKNANSNITGQVAVDGAISDCGAGVKFPLVVFSHGYTGCGTQSVFLTEELARRGYIVAAPDHNDHGCSVDGSGTQTFQDVNSFFGFKDFGNPDAWNPSEASYRNIDIKSVLDYMLNDSPWKDRINADEIAMSGHSLGGYTAFAKIGGWDSWLDTRFKAGIMYSPYIQGFMAQSPSRVPVPTVPQLFMGATLDTGITPCVMGPQTSQNNSSLAACPDPGQPGAFQQAQFPKYFGEVGVTGGNATHFAFTNLVCKSAGSVQGCLQSVVNAQLIVNTTSDFLDRYLQGQQVQTSSLFSPPSGWAAYWRTGGVPAGSYQPGASAAPLQIATIKGDFLTQGQNNFLTRVDQTYPTNVDGYTLTLTDSLGATRSAPIQYISPTQMNFIIPDGTSACPLGTTACQAMITVKDGSGAVVASGPLTINSISPSFFVSYPDAWVDGWAVNSSGAFNTWTKDYPSVSITDSNTYLVLWGTGFRFGLNLAAQAKIGDVTIPRVLIAADGQYQGVDQVAIGPLPSSLVPTGGPVRLPITVTVGNQTANIGWIGINPN